MMRAELHDFIDENKHRFGIDQLQSVHCFMKKYCIRQLKRGRAPERLPTLA